MLAKTLWFNMLKRINPSSNKARDLQYKDTVNLFESLDSFREWCSGEEGFGLLNPNGRHYELDKDLAVLAGEVNCKAYGKHCIFLPAKLNACLRIDYGVGGSLPGVTRYRDGVRWRMQYRDIDGVKHHGGLFTSELAAHQAWRATKAQVFSDASQLANDLGLTKAAKMFEKASNRFEGMIYGD